MATSFDAFLNKLIVNLAVDGGATIASRGNFTGDDNNGVVQAADVAAPNSLLAVDATGRVQIGGRDTGGNYNFYFDAGTTQASEFLADFTALLADYRTILADDPNDPNDQKDIAEQLLKRTAQAFGGTVKSDADFSGDDLGDAVNFSGPNTFSLETDPSQAKVGGRATSGNFVFDFDDQATAEAFLDAARTLMAYTADVL
jgi:hypothetical protein